MPLVVKDYSWEESDTHVAIEIPLKGLKGKNPDIFSTDNYLKVSFPPYIFECVTLKSFDEERCKGVSGNGVLTFTLIKKEPGLWSQLESPDMKDKEKMRWHREEAIRITQERLAEKEKMKQELKREQDKFALDEMIKIDQEERNRIDKEKERVKEEAALSMQLLKQQMEAEERERKRQLNAAREEANKVHREKMRRAGQEIFELPEDQPFGDTGQAAVRIESIEEIVAPLRKSDSIKVKFTERVFPTPTRESTADAEQEWLRKNAEARKIVDVDDKDLAEHDKDPVWLRDKGNSFFATGNFQAAVNVYSHAISLKCEWHSLYSNRAACHLKLRNLHKALEDSSRALELLNPPVPSNAKARVRAHIRRGTAFCELEMYCEGLLDYEAALRLDSDNASLQMDVENIRRMVEREP